ncbi:putative ankyrin repeat protein [Daldinia decipiens]|uniref:putative ankyrin repeat protein n=1 Tax=Daldinia decipiens TaxID=326647 RepID=UPI0020C277C6|nr:putative ankyrin repeat protein [Daldinia decipiens]KAI1654117.1 putative ankyrin repeat protein [Daldinia decipiens]
MSTQSREEAPAFEPNLNIPDMAGNDGNQDTISIKSVTSDLFSLSESLLPQGPESKQHKLGLDINHPLGWSGSAYDDYDVVTVHGIRDDYRTAWIDKDGSWWVKDKLFKDLSIREIDYSYDIDEDSELYEPNGIIQHARRLVEKYAEVRRELEETEVDRPVIWICHDLGGMIVKEALSIAINQCVKYGKIPMLTTAIFFLGTPHRFQSTDDLEDQLHKLILLPGPHIRSQVLSKVKNLARQVSMINQGFLATKVLDRAVIFNLFTQNIHDSLKQGNADKTANDIHDIDENDTNHPVTPFSRYTHFIGQSFEAAGRSRCEYISHEDLARGDPRKPWVPFLSDMFNTSGCNLKVDHRIIRFQARILSLAPPTRALDTPFDPALPSPPIVQWILDEQKSLTTIPRSDVGLSIMHIHGNGNPLVDILETSRLFYVHHGSQIIWGKSQMRPEKTMIYFEFDMWDSRYNSISSLLTYLINIILWRFWDNSNSVFIGNEFKFLNETYAWSPEDLYHLFTTFRDFIQITHQLTIFISYFDQCPEDQRRWFLKHTLEEQSYSEAKYRIIISTLMREAIDIEGFTNKTYINLESFPAIGESMDKVVRDLRLGLVGLIRRRPIYEDFLPQLESLFNGCSDTPYLGHIILEWLGNFTRGRPQCEIANIINRLFPPTAENIVQVFTSLLEPKLQSRIKNIFNWVKHAAEPWSPESLIQALMVHESHGGEPSFKDLDIEGMIGDIEDALGGIITVTDRNVRFSHPSFYHMPDMDIEGNIEERAAKVNSAIAEICLRYLQLESAQEELATFSPEKLDGGPWETLLDATIIFFPRTSMAEYAVRFWPQHYQASGQFKPTKLVEEIFASRITRASWEIPFWLFSNPTTRMRRSYVSTLPVFAMLGLDDLVDKKIKSESNQHCFEKNCWFAITEAARTGNNELTQKLLKQVTVDEEELQEALFMAAANGNADVINTLIDKIPNVKAFSWPKNLIFRATAAGLNSLLTLMLKSGCDINEIGSSYKMSPSMLAIWRNRVSTLELLLNSEPRPDLTIGDENDTQMTAAAAKGNPHIIELLLQGGASLEASDCWGQTPVRVAVEFCKHNAVDILIKAGADLERGETRRPLLIVAANMGLQECVRILLNHGADINTDYASGTALYTAIERGHVNTARTLLENKHKPNKDAAPPGHLMPLTMAVYNGSTELVSLLIQHGAQVDFVDPSDHFCKTPLSWACAEGDLDMVKLLLKNKADVNYTGGVSYTPLYAALWDSHIEVANHLLQNEDVDVKWVSDVGLGALHVAHSHPNIIRELLKRGAFIDSYSSSGTVLHLAAQYGHSRSIEALLENDPNPNLDCVYGDNGVFEDQIGCTPLQIACMHHKHKCVKVLLEAGANSRFKNKNGNDSVDILLLQTKTDSKDALECLKLLLSRVYNVPIDDVNEQGQTRLHRIEEKTPISMIQLLVELRAPLDSQDADGCTPLAVAIRKNNEGVARYLIEQGANVNILNPNFGSIIHLAISNSTVYIVRLLVKSGADLEAVDPKYGQSLLYTALDIQDDSKLKTMVRYLVDEAKVPIDKLGGQLGYPIIRAADLARTNHTTGTKMLKFLIRRNAQLNVADDQGRRAIHLACTSCSDDSIKALIKADAEVDVKDKFGRMPIHFAASSPKKECFDYLFDNFKAADINVADHDNWTPLLWAARSGHSDTIAKVTTHDVDIWARGLAYGAREDWSGLKLMNFANNSTELRDKLEPKTRTRINQDGEKEEWDDSQHSIKPGHWKDIDCKSCFVKIVGLQWKCIDCTHDFSLCFKCYSHRSDMHYREHNFEEIGPLYDENSLQSDISDGVKELLQEESGDEGEEQDHVSDGDDIGW